MLTARYPNAFCYRPNEEQGRRWKPAPSRIYDLLATLDTESLLLMMAKAKQDKAKKYVSLYLTALRNVKVELKGDDLKQMGIPPDPGIKRYSRSFWMRSWMGCA